MLPTPLNILTLKDKNQHTALHRAVLANDIELFYQILKFAFTTSQTTFLRDLSFCQNQKGESPWHLAARLGYLNFFLVPDEKYKAIWDLIYQQVFNFEDNEKNIPLHMAILFSHSANINEIKAKKKIVAALVKNPHININKKNAQHKTALHLAATHGCYETARELLSAKMKPVGDMPKKKFVNRNHFDIKDDKDQTAYTIAAKLGHQRLESAILFYKNEKQFKAKEGILTLQEIEADAKNPNMNDDEFIRRLKLTEGLEYDHVIQLIKLRTNLFRKKYRSKNLKMALFGALCPAVTLAAFLGGFGSLGPNPLLGFALTLFLLPVVYLPFVYVSYQSRCTEYTRKTAETLYFTWLATHLLAYEKKFKNKLNYLCKALKEIKNANVTTVADLAARKERYQQIKKEYAETLTEIQNVIELPPVNSAKKPKLKLSHLSRSEFKEIKKAGRWDAAANSDWVKPLENLRAFITAKDDLLCPLGAGLTVATSIATLIVGKTGLAFLGATAAAFFAGPVGIAVAVIATTIVLGLIMGFVLYKTSFKHEKAEMGKLNRELVMAHDACKRSSDFTKVQKLTQKFREVDEECQQFLAKEELALDHPKSEQTYEVKPARNSKIGEANLFTPKVEQNTAIPEAPPTTFRFCNLI